MILGVLEHPNQQVRTYVNGTLYSLLSNRRIQMHANEMQLDKVLKALLNISDDKFKKQL